MKNLVILIFVVIFLSARLVVRSQILLPSDDSVMSSMILQVMRESDIPGVSVAIIKGNEEKTYQFGYADKEKKIKTSAETSYELGSCTKSFTALAISHLQVQGKLGYGDNVSHYLPWFKPSYNGKSADITVEQLLNHTSGIPWTTIANIPESNEKDALLKTVYTLKNQKLSNLPGSKYEYATINYDVLALVLEKVTGQTYESYMCDSILTRLGLSNTYPKDGRFDPNLATGYKIGFSNARKFDAPLYKGNTAAGYIVSDLTDLIKWLRFQMGQTNQTLYPATKNTQVVDSTGNIKNMYYAGGWELSKQINSLKFHGGLNPNYTSFLAFDETRGIGVVVLANSNSRGTTVIGENIVKLLLSNDDLVYGGFDDKYDKICSLICILLCVYLLFVFLFLFFIGFTAKKYRQRLSTLTGVGVASHLFKLCLFTVPVAILIYVIPISLIGLPWKPALVWMPGSFLVAVYLIIVAVCLTWIASLVSFFFPAKSQYLGIAPRIVAMSLLAGFCNLLLVVLITNFINRTITLPYFLMYMAFVLALYIYSRRFVQISLVRISKQLVFDLRVNLTDRLLSTSLQKYELINKSKIYTTLNDDVGVIGESVNPIVSFLSSIFTALCAFVYLASIAFWPAIFTILLMLTLSVAYYFLGGRSKYLFEKARDSRNEFISFLNGMNDGYKELSQHKAKKDEYRRDFHSVINDYKEKVSKAQIRFANGALIGESLLMILLTSVVILIPIIHLVSSGITMRFLVVLLYLIGPINSMLRSIPTFILLKISIKRIKNFISELPNENRDLFAETKEAHHVVNSFEAKDIEYAYANTKHDVGFKVGPVSFSLTAGEVLFVVGGNGSGKTTLAKLICGLYETHGGCFKINGEAIAQSDLCERFSVIFSQPYLFSKIYGVELGDEKALDFLRLMNMDKKVGISNERYSNIKLSTGQLKRLSMIQCLVEDRNIYLFDEWAADQDPEFRSFFYRELIPSMKQQGKIIIAITHDDRYFGVADKIVKMDNGVMVPYDGLSVLVS